MMSRGGLKFEIILSLVLFLGLLVIAFTIDTTGDAGDSITHYLYSHYTFEYPQFFFNHWAKPLFVLLTAPFAQFGFKGIMVFNITCAILTALFTFYTARSLKIANPLLVFAFIFFAPLYFKLIFSGLTEYLFGLFLIVGIFLYQTRRFIPALIIISFLPVIRSEGLLIVGVFGAYCLLDKKMRSLPYLLVGQLVYSIVGAFYYKDLFWLMNEIPYANLGSPYGKGELLDFIHRLNYVIEKPIYLFLAIGSIGVLISFLRNRFKNSASLKTIVILGSFATFFVAHTIFWWQGIFNSMGLPRVLIAVVPLIAILSLAGLQIITDRINNSMIRKLTISGIILLIGIYPFTPRAEGVVFDQHLFVLEENNLIEEEVAPYIKKNFPNYADSPVYFSHPYLSLALDIDPFDQNQHREMQFLQTDTIARGSIIIWDEWFSPVEGGISLELLMNKEGIELAKSFQRQDGERTIQFVVFKTMSARR